MKRLFALTLLVVLLASPAYAQELQGTLKKIRDAGIIVIGYRDRRFPSRS